MDSEVDQLVHWRLQRMEAAENEGGFDKDELFLSLKVMLWRLS